MAVTLSHARPPPVPRRTKIPHTGSSQEDEKAGQARAVPPSEVPGSWIPWEPSQCWDRSAVEAGERLDDRRGTAALWLPQQPGVRLASCEILLPGPLPLSSWVTNKGQQLQDTARGMRIGLAGAQGSLSVPDCSCSPIIHPSSLSATTTSRACSNSTDSKGLSLNSKRPYN